MPGRRSPFYAKDVKKFERERGKFLAIDRIFFHGWCTCPAPTIIEEGWREKVWEWIFDRSEVIRRLFVSRVKIVAADFSWMEMKRKVIFIFRFRNYSLHELELDWKLEASRGRDFCVRDVVAVKFNIYDDNDSEIVESRGHNSNQQETTDREDKEFQSLSFKRSVFFSSARRSKQLAY